MKNPTFYLRVVTKAGERVGHVREVLGALTFEEAERYSRGHVIDELARGRFEGATISQCVGMKKGGFELVPATADEMALV